MNIPHCPDDWPHYQWFRLFRRGQSLAAEVTASMPERRAWVIVRPIQEDYRILYFEIERVHYEEALETMDYDQFLLDAQRLTATNETTVKAAINRWLDDLSVLRDPGVTTSPI